MPRRKRLAFWLPLSTLLLADCTSKQFAEDRLVVPHVPHDIVGDVVRFTLAYNPDAAFSLSVGDHTRWIFTLLAIGVLAVLARLYRQTGADDRLQAAALALIAGGALGNLLDRVRSARGVVDFIDIGYGDLRFWTFNLADVGVTGGALLMALIIVKRQERGGALVQETGDRKQETGMD